MRHLLIILLLLTSLEVQASQDSSVVIPPSVTNVKKIQVNVLHMTQAGISFNTIPPNPCPTGASLIWSKFFPMDPTDTIGVNFSYTPGGTTNGIYAFICREAFYESDSYYKDLQSATWANPTVDCQNVSMTNTKCSTLLQKPPLILFVFKVPATAAMKSWDEFLTFRDATVYYYDRKIGSKRIGMAFNNYNLNTDLGPLYFTFMWDALPNTETYITWYFQGENADGQNDSSARGDDNRWGYYRCSAGVPGASVIPFNIAIYPIMAGQTCTVSCKGDWTLEPNIGGKPTWWSQYNEVLCTD